MASGAFCCFFWRISIKVPGDFGWAIRLAQHLRALQSIRHAFGAISADSCPFRLAVRWPAREVAGGLFYGISSAALAFGLTRQGYQRLLVFLAYPYWAGFLAAQWAPLIMASAFFPLFCRLLWLSPRSDCRWLNPFTMRGVVACVVVAAHL